MLTGATRIEITSCIFWVHQFRDRRAYHLTRQRSALTWNENFDSLPALSHLSKM